MKFIRVNGRLYRVGENIDTGHPKSWGSCWVAFAADGMIIDIHRKESNAQKAVDGHHRLVGGKKGHVGAYFLKP